MISRYIFDETMYRLCYSETFNVCYFRSTGRHCIRSGATAISFDSRLWVNHLILLYTALVLSAVNGCCGYCTAADKQQSNPQQKIGVISRLRRLVGAGFDGAAGQLCRYGIGLLDFLCCRSVLVILLATGAVPILDIALSGLGRRLCREVL